MPHDVQSEASAIWQGFTPEMRKSFTKKVQKAFNNFQDHLSSPLSSEGIYTRIFAKIIDENDKDIGINSKKLCGIEGPELECLSKLPGKGPLLLHKKWDF